MSSWDGDSEQALEDWRNHMHEVSTHRCAYMMKSLLQIGAEVCEFPIFDGIKDLDTFICDYQEQVPERDRLKALDVAMKATPM